MTFVRPLRPLHNTQYNAYWIGILRVLKDLSKRNKSARFVAFLLLMDWKLKILKKLNFIFYLTFSRTSGCSASVLIARIRSGTLHYQYCRDHLLLYVWTELEAWLQFQGFAKSMHAVSWASSVPKWISMSLKKAGMQFH